MATNMNIHTGDKIITKPSSSYAEGWDRVFGDKPSMEAIIKQAAAQAHAKELDSLVQNLLYGTPRK